MAVPMGVEEELKKYSRYISSSVLFCACNVTLGTAKSCTKSINCSVDEHVLVISRS